MKKVFLLGAMAFLAINLTSVQHADAQVNKQREQFLQANKEGNKPDDLANPDNLIQPNNLVKPENPAKSDDPAIMDLGTAGQNSPSKVNKQREQMLQSAKGLSTPDDPIKPNEDDIEVPGAIRKQGSVTKIKHVTEADKDPFETEQKVQKKVKVLKESSHQGALIPEEMKTVDRDGRPDGGVRKAPAKRIDQTEQSVRIERAEGNERMIDKKERTERKVRGEEIDKTDPQEEKTETVIKVQKIQSMELNERVPR